MPQAREEFLKPTVINVDTVDDTRARVTLEPLERGFGVYAWTCVAPHSAVLNAGSGGYRSAY